MEFKIGFPFHFLILVFISLPGGVFFSGALALRTQYTPVSASQRLARYFGREKPNQCRGQIPT